MPTTRSDDSDQVAELRVARVLRVEEATCEVWSAERITTATYAPMFPTPHSERVSPGHLVALAADGTGQEVVVWRWYDAVVLGPASDGTVRLWEPAHGETVAHVRASFGEVEPGTRVYASAGLPGAEWWATAPADRVPHEGDIDLAEVDALYTDNGLWEKVFTPDR